MSISLAVSYTHLDVYKRQPLVLILSVVPPGVMVVDCAKPIKWAKADNRRQIDIFLIVVILKSL